MDHYKEPKTKHYKKSSKEKNTFDKYGKNTQKGACIKETDRYHLFNNNIKNT